MVDTTIQERAIQLIEELTGKDRVTLTPSGDHSILWVLQELKRHGIKRVLIQDQGGWLTYKDYPKKLGLPIVELPVRDGKIDLDALKREARNEDALLINSMNGYFALDDIDTILDICAESGTLLINDISASIGTKEAKLGNIIICSFGKDKPVNNHYGGCITTNNPRWTFQEQFDMSKLPSLVRELEHLPRRLASLRALRAKILSDLDRFDVIAPRAQGINVLVRYKNTLEKSRLLSYCREKGYPYTLCPRYIRVTEDAVSIEVKRLRT